MERISKPNYYLDIAQTVAKRGTCLRRKFGCIIVKNDIIVSTGYNGAPRGRKNCCDMGFCQREHMGIPRGERYELCRSVHAEANAIISAARSEILDILLDFIQDERHSVLLSSHITTDLEQIADTIAYLHHGQLLFAKNKDDLMEEYGILRCSQQDLDRLPPEWIAATCRTAAGCESLVHPRVSVLRALPGVVCDAASIDDIMRLTSKEG